MGGEESPLKVSRKKEIIKTKVDINEIENRKTIGKTNKLKVYSIKCLANLTNI